MTVNNTSLSLPTPPLPSPFNTHTNTLAHTHCQSQLNNSYVALNRRQNCRRKNTGNSSYFSTSFMKYINIELHKFRGCARRIFFSSLQSLKLPVGSLLSVVLVTQRSLEPIRGLIEHLFDPLETALKDRLKLFISSPLATV